MRKSVLLVLILCGLLVVFPVLNAAQEDEGDEDTTEAVQEETDTEVEESESEDIEEAQEDENAEDTESEDGAGDEGEESEGEEGEEITQGLGIGVLLLGLGAVMAVGMFWVGTNLANTDDDDNASENVTG